MYEIWLKYNKKCPLKHCILKALFLLLDDGDDDDDDDEEEQMYELVSEHIEETDSSEEEDRENSTTADQPDEEVNDELDQHKAVIEDIRFIQLSVYTLFSQFRSVLMLLLLMLQENGVRHRRGAERGGAEPDEEAAGETGPQSGPALH